MYKLFCDSNCELWHTTVKDLGLDLIRMPYVLEDKEYYYDMGENTDFHGFFDKMRHGAVPKTSALNEFDYIGYFEPVLEAGFDIYYVSFSWQMSGTFSAMRAAIDKLKQKYPDREIRCKDTKTISMGSGFITYYAALKYNDGASMDELDEYLDELIKHTATYFVVDDLTYLHRGGRVSGISKVIGNLLNIKPILHFDDDGRIVNICKANGIKKALHVLKSFMEETGEAVGEYKVYVLYADCEAAAKGFADALREQFGELDLTLQPVGPVIGSHCGPGTIGLIFHCSHR